MCQYIRLISFASGIVLTVIEFDAVVYSFNSDFCLDGEIEG